MKKRIAIIITSLIIASVSLQVSSVSFDNFISYRYDSWNEPVRTPDAYFVKQVVSGTSAGIDAFLTPTDMFVTTDDELYILDPGKNRVVVLDNTYKFTRQITGFTDNGSEYFLSKDASGIYVDEEGYIFIADTGNKIVLVCDDEGEIVHKFVKPNSPLYPQEVDFKPSKVLTDSSGNTYVLVSGLYYGAIVYNPDGNFQTFFGTNNVTVTARVLADYFWKKIMTDEQKKQLGRYVPIAYTNMYIDRKNFIYTCTDNSLRKLNPGGKEVLRKGSNLFFGDYYTVWDHGKPINTIFTDLVVESNGIVSMLDSARGKIFQYGPESDLLYAFGGSSNQLGTFKDPSAIEAMNGDLLVLDSKNADITVFEPTAFAMKVRMGSDLYNTGKYENSLELWGEVLKADANYELAYTGLGKAQFNLGEFDKAMVSFRLGEDRMNYSLAKKEYRSILLQKYFGLIGTVMILLIIFAAAMINLSSIKNSKLIKKWRRKNV
ncbi:MAG: hypothetical protein WC212_08200 [Candidatus Delongbacteria bacterium]